MLLVADPDRAEGASTHNLEDGQRNGRRELTRCFWLSDRPRAGLHAEAPFQVAEAGAPAQREQGKPARQPSFSAPWLVHRGAQRLKHASGPLWAMPGGAVAGLPAGEGVRGRGYPQSGEIDG